MKAAINAGQNCWKNGGTKPARTKTDDGRRQKADGVGADGEERGVAKIEQSGVTDDDVQPHGEQGIDANREERSQQVKAKRLVDEWEGDQEDEDGAEDDDISSRAGSRGVGWSPSCHRHSGRAQGQP